jgi:Protein of unknown function (DUF3300)
MNSRRLFQHRSRSLHVLAAAAFISMAGCIVQVAPNDQPQQYAAAPAPPAPDAPAADPGLQELVAPIALYPDPILADVLPAATYPDEVQQAAQFVQSNPNPADDQVSQQNWDPSVQALVYYPDVLQYMAANIQWTQSLGAAFVNQQPETMQAIQDLRAQAQAEGNLQTNEYQYVDSEGGFIYIRPAQDDFVIVPVYDPVLVYRQRSDINFNHRYREGAWLNHGFDWQHHDVFTGDWRRGWTGGPGNWHRDPNFAAQQQHWQRDNRREPVHQVAPAHYAMPHEMQGRDFHAVPQRTEVPNRGPIQATPERRDDHPQVQQRPLQPSEHQEQPAERHDTRVPAPAQPDNHSVPPHEVEHPQNEPQGAEKPHGNPTPPPEQHAKPMPPTKQAPAAKPKEPPQKPEGGN